MGSAERIGTPPRLEPTDGVATIQGMPFVVPDGERASVSRRLLASGVTEPRFTDVVRRLVRPADHVLDVGANIGYFTCLMAQRVGGDGRVVAFEPVERPRRYLRHNATVNGFGTVTIDDRALADFNGSGYLTLPAYRLQAEVSGGERVAFEVSVRRLDDLAPELGIARLDVVKMDIEGAELRALEGMRSVLERHRPILAIEVHPAFLANYGDSVQDLEAFLGELGYASVAIEPPGGPATNHHVVAGTPDALRAARLLPAGPVAILFALDGVQGWSRGRRSVVALQDAGGALELTFALGEGEKEYLVTAEHTTGKPPAAAKGHALGGDRYTELRWDAELEGPAHCSLWLFEYDRRSLVAQTSFALEAGAHAVPHVSAPAARSYRLGLRVSGAGTVRLRRLELSQA